jgi:hypothetical protein
MKAPDTSDWARVATVDVSASGIARWRWSTTEDDVDNHDPYRLRFNIPNHGHSNTVRVLVTTPDS